MIYPAIYRNREGRFLLARQGIPAPQHGPVIVYTFLNGSPEGLNGSLGQHHSLQVDFEVPGKYEFVTPADPRSMTPILEQILYLNDQVARQSEEMMNEILRKSNGGYMDFSEVIALYQKTGREIAEWLV